MAEGARNEIAIRTTDRHTGLIPYNPKHARMQTFSFLKAEDVNAYARAGTGLPMDEKELRRFFHHTLINNKLLQQQQQYIHYYIITLYLHIYIILLFTIIIIAENTLLLIIITDGIRNLGGGGKASAIQLVVWS